MDARDNLRTLWALALVSLGGVNAPGQVPQLILHPISRIPESVLLSIRPHTTSWVLSESSSDLASWRPVANVLTTNSTAPFVVCPGSNALDRFYGVRSPGVATAEAQGLRLAHVTYDEQRGFPAAVLLVGGGGIPITDYRITQFTELPIPEAFRNKITGANTPRLLRCTADRNSDAPRALLRP